MSLKPTLLLAAAAVASSLVLGPRVFAQPAEAPSSPPPPSGQGMMDGRGLMGRNGMPGTMGMTSEMNRMAENCNRMMESMNTGRNLDGPKGNAEPMRPRG